EDYMGIDPDTGELVHLHVHYELTLGEKYLKGYRIPWEKTLLDRRERDDEHGIWTSDAASELLILVVRAVLKARWRDVLRGSRAAMPDHMDRELRWLANRTTPEEVRSLARELLGDEAATHVCGLMVRPETSGLRALKTAIAPQLKLWKTYSTSGAVVRRWYREFLVRFGAVQRRVGAGVSPRRRIMPRGGAFIAFVGPDGSGKSTLTGEVASWLSWKLDVLRVYGGSGAQSAGFPRRMMQRARALTRRQGAGSRAGSLPPSRVTRSADVDLAAGPAFDEGTAAGSGVDAGQTESRSPADISSVRAEHVSIARAAWTVSLARERIVSARSARYARNRGMVVLSDRLAQTQFAGINDGPRLGSYLNGSSLFRRMAARYEQESFRCVEQSPPDLVIRLHLSYSEARTRKPDTPEEQLQRKLEIVPRLTWPAGTRVVEIDASQPLNEVLKAVKFAVWDVL
ncbi:MAG TPA: hypothetical protein VKZ41_06685, partial [Gemmatimonadales bacterium]|nr:hypothetical protein [Gemmatimonadales bacterium]